MSDNPYVSYEMRSLWEYERGKLRQTAQEGRVTDRYPQYTIWKDFRTGDYEVVRWNDGRTPVVLQANIKTRAKATEALKIWQQREAERDTKG
jgi:hypothetical protein